MLGNTSRSTHRSSYFRRREHVWSRSKSQVSRTELRSSAQTTISTVVRHGNEIAAAGCFMSDETLFPFAFMFSSSPRLYCRAAEMIRPYRTSAAAPRGPPFRLYANIANQAGSCQGRKGGSRAGCQPTQFCFRRVHLPFAFWNVALD